MASNAQGRIVLGLCLDKERDEKLINFLSAQKNKSDFIRQILYAKIADVENGNNNMNSDNSIAILTEILSVLTQISNSINSLALKSFININTSSATNALNKPNSTADVFSDKDSLVESLSAVTDDNISSEDDLLFEAVADSFDGF